MRHLRRSLGTRAATDPVWIDNDYAFVCFGKKVLRQMPFLPQPSPFIRVWDRDQETQKCASDGWVATSRTQKSILSFFFDTFFYCPGCCILYKAKQLWQVSCVTPFLNLLLYAPFPRA